MPSMGPVMSSNPKPGRLLIVDDDDDLREALVRRFQRKGLIVQAAATAQSAIACMRQGCDVALLDLRLPDMSGTELLARLKEEQPELEAIMLTGHGSTESAVEAMKKGAFDYLSKPFDLPELEIHIQKALEKVRLARRERQWVDQLRYESPRFRLIGSSPAMQRVVQLIDRVAPTDSTVLIRGASGTGKELVARALHYNSTRRDRPIVTINCASLQENLLESELFGHEKGSFTGAQQAKPGLVEVAEGGTLFIDEIAEMATGLQAKLLRVLENGHYRRVGSTHEVQADVRVVAATNKVLEDEMKAGRFREDLYYRLNVVAIELPLLRDRRQDIPELVEHFLSTRSLGPVRCAIERKALEALTHYDWPGNVRELANVLERAQILAEDRLIRLDNLPDNVVSAVAASEAGASTETSNQYSEPRTLREVERRHVESVLLQEKGNRLRAARVLGISRRALYRLIKKHGLSSCSAKAEAMPSVKPSAALGEGR